MLRSSLYLAALLALAPCGCHSYLEVENEGAYQEIAAGASLWWTVRWFSSKVDDSVAVQAGNADRLDAARTLVKS